jgi:hypothetical protein
VDTAGKLIQLSRQRKALEAQGCALAVQAGT